MIKSKSNNVYLKSVPTEENKRELQSKEVEKQEKRSLIPTKVKERKLTHIPHHHRYHHPDRQHQQITGIINLLVTNISQYQYYSIKRHSLAEWMQHMIHHSASFKKHILTSKINITS